MKFFCGYIFGLFVGGLLMAVIPANIPILDRLFDSTTLKPTTVPQTQPKER